MKLSNLVKNPTKAKWRDKKRKIKFYLKKYNELIENQPVPDLNVEEDNSKFLDEFKKWLTTKTICIQKLEELGYVIEADSSGVLEQGIKDAIRSPK